MKPITAEVCVLGDGPAGSSAAARLALLGHNVVLIGDGAPRRRPLPESISPGIHPLLDALDLSHALNTFATECAPPDVRWEASEPPPLDQPASTPSAPSGHLVDRSKLDACLLQSARQAGVQVIATRSGAPDPRVAGGWRIPLPMHPRQEVHAGFLIVATGRKPLLSRKRQRIMPPLLALYSRWKLPHSARPRIAVEALPDGWVWRAELADGICCAAAFMDPLLRSRCGQKSIESNYLAFLSEATIFNGHLSAPRIDKVSACDASALLANEVIGPDWMLVGDSAVALEPISSQGIQIALKLGLQAAVVAHTLLSDPSSAPIAETFYREQCRGIAARHRKATTEFYATPERFQREPFWTVRASHKTNPPPPSTPTAPIDPATPLRLSSEATLREIPCLIGDRIRLQPALHHPNLDAPVSHLGNVAVAALLSGIVQPQSSDDLCRLWTQTGLTERPLPLLHWFLKNGILTPTDAPA